MKTTWSWSYKAEANRILHTAHQIASGFYQLHHFYPLATEPGGVTYIPQGVYLPELPYHEIPQFWSSVRAYDPKAMIVPPTLEGVAARIEDMLKSAGYTPLTTDELQTSWEAVAPRFAALVHTLAPYTPEIESVEVHRSAFGTGGSFNRASDNPARIIVDLRRDQDLTHLTECILTSLTRHYVCTHMDATWEESEFLVDYLLQHTELATLFPTPHTGTLSMLRQNVSPSIIQTSLKFLQKIGAPMPSEQQFTVKNDIPHFGNHALTSLTSRESNVLAALITNSPEPLTLDQISDIIFAKDEKYSLAALSKFIERLRDKLAELGISRHYLATASGVGYYLKN